MFTAFLDRDGVINRQPAGQEYVRSWEEFEFLPGVVEAIRLLKQHGFLVIVITNQRGVSLGKVSEEGLAMIHQRMSGELAAAGAALDAIYCCPHDLNSCDCRKPATGLFLQAQRQFPAIRFEDSFMIGDSVSDMEAAQRLGCKKVLIASDPALASGLPPSVGVDFSASSLLQAVTGYLLPR